MQAIGNEAEEPASAQPAVQVAAELFATRESAVAPAIDPASPERFVNRELSWLAFNGRVLEEAQNPRHPVLERLRFLSNPLLERVKFLAIVGSNIDEFYMVRVAGLRGMVNEGVATPSADGLSPSEQLARIHEVATKLLTDQQGVWVLLRAELRKEGIALIEPEELTDADKEWLDVQFREQIFPILTPLAIDPAHPFVREVTVPPGVDSHDVRASLSVRLPTSGTTTCATANR